VTKRIGIICFSPTNTTRSICEAIASGMGSEKPTVLNMTSSSIQTGIITDSSRFLADIDHLIVGSPVHSGKLPLKTIEWLEALRATGKEGTAIVVYGNRDYGIALSDLVKRLSEKGLTVVAAGAFIGQHTYSDIIPVAVGRPDKSDMEKARGFGARIANASKRLSLDDVPIQIDKFSKSDKYSALKPSYIEEQCTQCGKCAKACPLSLVSPDSGRYLSKAAEKQCIGCLACVRNCTQKARVIKANLIVKNIMKSILGQASRERKEPLMIN
jgi:Pyruvate/2-oxoacid:ferredoxin oxidoreductase delta subunit/flavodoxin